MKYSIKEVTQLSGDASRIYTVSLDGKGEDEFREFMRKWKGAFPDEVSEIAKTLKVIGKWEGAREHYFKKAEGKLGDLVCALYDKEEANLRLYCIRYGMGILIVGGGADKPEGVRAWQNKDDLKDAAELMIKVSDDIYRRMREKEIQIDHTTNSLIGNLEFDDDEE